MANRNRDLHPNPNHNVIPILHLHNAECMKLQKKTVQYTPAQQNLTMTPTVAILVTLTLTLKVKVNMDLYSALS